MLEELCYMKFSQLRIANCKMRFPMSKFLELLEKKAHVRKLALVSMDIND